MVGVGASGRWGANSEVGVSVVGLVREGFIRVV